MKEVARKRLAGMLVEQMTALGIPSRRAREVARTEVDRWDGDANTGRFLAPYLVTPHALGWCVTRALAAIEAEVFPTRDSAVERARDLAAAESSVVVVCDSRGKVLERHPPGDGR